MPKTDATTREEMEERIRRPAYCREAPATGEGELGVAAGEGAVAPIRLVLLVPPGVLPHAGGREGSCCIKCCCSCSKNTAAVAR